MESTKLPYSCQYCIQGCLKCQGLEDDWTNQPGATLNKEGPEAIEELLRQFPAEVQDPPLSIHDRLKNVETKLDEMNAALQVLVAKKQRKTKVKVLNG